MSRGGDSSRQSFGCSTIKPSSRGRVTRYRQGCISQINQQSLISPRGRGQGRDESFARARFPSRALLLTAPARYDPVYNMKKRNALKAASPAQITQSACNHAHCNQP